MRKLIFSAFAVLGMLLINSPVWAQADLTAPVTPGNSYLVRIMTGTSDAGEAASLANRLCLYRVDVDPAVQVQCYSPEAPVAAFPEGFTLQVTMTFSVPPLTEPQFRATAENTEFEPVKVSELSVNKLTLTWPAPARPVLAP